VTASIWLPVIAGVMVLFALMMVAVLTGGYLLWRHGRRRWRAFHSHGLVVAATGVWQAASSGHLRTPSPMSADAAGQWPARRVRKEMWRAVDQADAAVRAAGEVGAPTASLPSMCTQLRQAAIGIDQVLRVDPAGKVPAGVARQAFEVARAAADLQRAALASASDATGEQVRRLVHDADQEIRLLDAGLDSARSVMPRPSPNA
jgi:hypothetical protein